MKPITQLPVEFDEHNSVLYPLLGLLSICQRTLEAAQQSALETAKEVSAPPPVALGVLCLALKLMAQLTAAADAAPLPARPRPAEGWPEAAVLR